MTVSSTVSRNDYVGGNTTDTYNYSFRIISSSHLAVYQKLDGESSSTQLTLDIDYTVTGVGSGSGGTIVLTAGNLATDALLTIRRVVPLTQVSDYRNAGAIYLEVLEDSLDVLTWAHQQQQDELDRSIQHDPTTSGVSALMPAPEALQVLRWNTAGNGLENVEQGSVALAVPGDGTVTLAKMGSDVGTVVGKDVLDPIDKTITTIRASTDVVSPLSVDLIVDSLIPSGTLVASLAESDSTVDRDYYYLNGSYQYQLSNMHMKRGWVLCDGRYIGPEFGVILVGDPGISLSRFYIFTPYNCVHPLFQLLWDNESFEIYEKTGSYPDEEMMLTTRGATALADYIAYKSFKLPDLRGRAIIGAGTGTDLTARTLGDVLGAETHTLTVDELAAHTHNITGSSGTTSFGNVNSGNLSDESCTTQSTGGDAAHNNMQPSFVANWMIKL